MDATRHARAGAGAPEVTLAINGAQPLSAELVEATARACDRVEGTEGARLVVRVGGAPAAAWADDLMVGLVSKWERGLRRLERLPAVTVAVADGDCGGAALDVLLAADLRIATTVTRLLVPVTSGAASGTWPGMALYRLVNQGSNIAAVRRAVLFGEPIDASQARALHLVDEVTDDVDGALADVAALTAGRSGAELAIRRQLMFDALTTSFEEALGAHLAACDRVLRHRSAEVAS